MFDEQLRRAGWRVHNYGERRWWFRDKIFAATRVALMQRKRKSERMRWYVGAPAVQVEFLRFTPTNLRDLAGPFMTWQQAAACYAVMAGVQ